MKVIFQLAWRNIWRNKRRSLVVMSSIAIGIFVMLITMAFMNGMNRQMIDNTINTSLGHVAIHSKGYHDDMKIEKNFRYTDKIKKILKDEKRIRSVTERVKVQSMIRSAEASRGVMLVGIDPASEKNVSSIYEYTSKEEGSRFLNGRKDDGILISKTLAGKLDLLIGDRCVLMLKDRSNTIQGIGVRVAGLYESPVDSFDKFVIFAGIETIQDITGIGRNISELTIISGDRNKVDELKSSIINSLKDPGLEVLSWKDLAPNLVSAVALFDNMMYIFFMIIFITVIFSIANTLIMAIMERFHEIGVMKSVGTRPSWIFLLVICEAINLCFVGLFAGIILGTLCNLLLGMSGINLAFYMESMRTWGTGSIIYPLIRGKDIIVCILIVLITALLAALYPAIKAARVKPLEALHHI